MGFNLHSTSTGTPSTLYKRIMHVTANDPSEKSRPDIWPGKYMGKATSVWHTNPISGKACSTTKGGLLLI